MSVVAECIETNAQAALLKELHCNYGQGYLFSPALPPDKVEAWLTTRSSQAQRSHA